jgi:hypothetical protein
MSPLVFYLGLNGLSVAVPWASASTRTSSAGRKRKHTIDQNEILLHLTEKYERCSDENKKRSIRRAATRNYKVNLFECCHCPPDCVN